MIIIKNVYVLQDNTFKIVDILIKNNKLLEIVDNIKPDHNDIIINANNRIITQEFIALHTHLYEAININIESINKELEI